MPPTDLKDFFVSYNRADKTWAEWIAWTLEEAGYSVLIQAWDFRPGGKFVLDMQRAAAGTQRTIAVLSEAYLQSAYTQPEWAAAFANDPRSQARNLIPIRVGECQPDGMLRPIVYVDLVGLSEAEAQQAVLGMMGDRAKPAQKPTFPGAAAAIKHTVPAPTKFPGNASDGHEQANAPTPELPTASTLTTTPLLPHFSTYKAETWTGRTETVAELTDVLTAGCRLLLIHGMTGIGKTTLAEKLAADLLVNDGTGSADRLSLPPDIEFHRLSFDIGTPSTDFTRGALTILQAIGDDTAQQLPDEQILPYLLKTLEQRPYWLQFDSLEYLLHQTSDGAYHFADAAWVTFFVQLLNSSRSQSRLVLTSQVLPADLVDQIYRYDQLWHEYPLRGLESAHWLDLFRNYNITTSTDTERDRLCHIASYFQGHPLILKMIAGDIRSHLFGGSISKYWTEYYSPQQTNPRQAAATLRQSQEQRARQWVSQTIQQLPDLPRQMLQRSAVFRRPVAETFYLQMLEASESALTAALTTLKSRNLVEDTDIQARQILIQQHNLIRDSAYVQLKTTPPTWETAERTAAHLWLTAYTSPPNAERIETIRDHLEAFDHYCEVKDWDDAKTILLDQQIGVQLQTWGKYREMISYHQKLISHLDGVEGVACKRGLGNAYLFLGSYSQATDWYQKSLDLACEIGDRTGEGRALGNIGLAYYYLGQYEHAIVYHQQHLIIAREIGDRQGEGNALGNLGLAYYSQGQYEQAIAHHQQHLTIAREIGDRRGEGDALGNLGLAYKSQGQYEQAIVHYQQYLTIAREIGNRQGEGIALGNWGDTQIKLEHYPDALENTNAALAIFREIGFRAAEAEALKNLAELHQKLGEAEVARGYCEQALALATELGIPLVKECEELKATLEESRE